MNTAGLLRTMQQQARGRCIARALALGLPWCLAAGALAWRFDGGIALLWPASTLVLTVLLAWRSASSIDAVWLARQLDQKRKDLEDSAGLLFVDGDQLSMLPRLQRARLEQRLQTVPAPDLRPSWPVQALARNAALAAAITVLVVLWPAQFVAMPTTNPAVDAKPGIATATRITLRQLAIRPPSYTGLPMRSEDSLQAKVPEGSMLGWTLRFAPQPTSATLVFHDGNRLPLLREGDDWTGSRRIGKATLYKLVLTAAPALSDQRHYRIDVVNDRPPQIRVTKPERSLSLLEDGQKQWSLVFEASDDFGLGAAQLGITLAQGSGENIKVSERALPLQGQGNGRRRRYVHALDLAALGFAVGDDLIVRLTVSDNRTPQPQTARSASFILRWPPATGAEASGLEGMMKKVLPAYFRSQRQIIIDSEALLKQRRTLAKDDYVGRSDVIGIDQRILRLRYGQFLGEEVDEGPKSPVDGDKGEDGHDDHEQDSAVAPAQAIGDATSVVEAFGHSHDIAEAATLLDPETRGLLKKALDQMWQAELHLRQGHPEAALPFEYRALGFIKQVQQAGRIYLAKVGLELPAIDESRRLTGDRKGLQSRADLLAPVDAEDSPVVALWRRLDTRRDQASVIAATADLDAFERWLRQHEKDLPDALDLYAGIDALRSDPGCSACARRLRARLWSLLPAPAGAISVRHEASRSGRAYLDALQREYQR